MVVQSHGECDDELRLGVLDEAEGEVGHDRGLVAGLALLGRILLHTNEDTESQVKI